MVAKTGIKLGRRCLEKGIDSGTGNKTIRETHSMGLRVGNVKASGDLPVSTETHHVEQTLDNCWALRPDSIQTTDVEEDQKRGAE
jgi:hypothetical protein